MNIEAWRGPSFYRKLWSLLREIALGNFDPFPPNAQWPFCNDLASKFVKGGQAIGDSVSESRLLHRRFETANAIGPIRVIKLVPLSLELGVPLRDVRVRISMNEYALISVSVMRLLTHIPSSGRLHLRLFAVLRLGGYPPWCLHQLLNRSSHRLESESLKKEPTHSNSPPHDVGQFSAR